MPKQLIIFFTAVAKFSRVLTGWAALSMHTNSPGLLSLSTPTIDWSTIPTTRTLTFPPSFTNSIAADSTPRKSEIIGAYIANGPFPSSLVIAPTAATCSAVHVESTLNPPIQSPSDIIALDWATITKRTPAIGVEPKNPSPISNASATLQ